MHYFFDFEHDLNIYILIICEYDVLDMYIMHSCMLFILLSVCLSVCLSLSVCLCLCLCLSLSLCLSFSVSLSLSLSLSLSVSLSLSLSIVNMSFWVYNYFVFDCFCCFLLLFFVFFARGLDVKKYCTYSFTLVNKKFVRSFVLSLSLLPHFSPPSLSPFLFEVYERRYSVTSGFGRNRRALVFFPQFAGKLMFQLSI